MKMNSKVAIVRTNDGCKMALQRAIRLIGGIDDLNVKDRDVTIKIGVYDPKGLNHPTLEATKAVVEAFNRAPRVFLAESDNRVQGASERLQIWKEAFTKRVSPFNLTEDKDTRAATIIGEKVKLSHILYKPNVRVSLHAYHARSPDVTYHGAALKNLLGIIPDIKKDRFHEKLGIALVDMLDSIGCLDLAVLDAVYTYYGKFEEGKPLNRMRTDLLIVGRDAVAVDAVGAALNRRNPLEAPSLVEAMKRGLGQADLNKIEILGEPLKDVKIELAK